MRILKLVQEDLNTEKLDQIISDINDFDNQMTEHYETDVENSYAEYCFTFSYGEMDKDELVRNVIRQLREDYDDIPENVINFIESSNKKELFELLELNVSLDFVGLRLRTGEIHSVTMGEIELELPEKIQRELANLNFDETKYVERGVDSYITDNNIYLDLNYKRWVIILDTESLLGEIEYRLK